jgi:hypothetical protein
MKSKLIEEYLLLLSYCDRVLVTSGRTIGETIRESSIQNLEGVAKCLLLHARKSESLSLRRRPRGCTYKTQS